MELKGEKIVIYWKNPCNLRQKVYKIEWSLLCPEDNTFSSIQSPFCDV